MNGDSSAQQDPLKSNGNRVIDCIYFTIPELEAILMQISNYWAELEFIIRAQRLRDK